MHYLGAEQLVQLRANAITEIVVAAQNGGDLHTMRQLGELVAKVDERLDRRERNRLQARIAVAASKSPTFHTSSGNRTPG